MNSYERCVACNRSARVTLRLAIMFSTVSTLCFVEACYYAAWVRQGAEHWIMMGWVAIGMSVISFLSSTLLKMIAGNK